MGGLSTPCADDRQRLFLVLQQGNLQHETVCEFMDRHGRMGGDVR